MSLNRLEHLANAASDLWRTDLGAEAWVPTEVLTQMRETVASLAALQLRTARVPVVAPDEFRDAFPD